MSSGSERTSVTIFADHEVIVPAHKLGKAVSTKLVLPGEDPVERAEAALAQLSSQFADWMSAECDRLHAARDAVKARGFAKDTREELFHAAHDIKGGAATMGYPLAAPAAESLCRVIEHSPDLDRVPIALIDQHVDAVRAIVREYARPDIADVATALNRKLHGVTYDFLVHENRHRPGYLDGVFTAPPAPGDF